jgi:hypothetical protein
MAIPAFLEPRSRFQRAKKYKEMIMPNLKVKRPILPMPRGTQPTSAQLAWLRANPDFTRTSNVAHLAKFTNRGTLLPDGVFVAERPGYPIMDGNGAFGVGILVPAKRKR